jgi:transcriptional regulator with XRE-family HTH domain
MDIGTRIKIMRKKNGWSQADLATRVGVDRTSISNWEINRREPDISALQKLSSVLDVSISYLTGESDLPMPDKNTDYVNFMLTASNDQIRERYGTEIDNKLVTDQELEMYKEQIRSMRKLLNTFQKENKKEP